MKTFQTNSIWGVEPRPLTDVVSKRDLDCKCSRCKEIKPNDIFIFVWGKTESYKYCDDCSSDVRFKCNYGFNTTL